jgi:hypothetical protein
MDLCVMPEMIKSLERKPHDGTQHACEVHLSCGCHCPQDPFYSNFSQPSAPGSHISQIPIPTWAVLLSEKFSTQAMKVACPNSIDCCVHPHLQTMPGMHAWSTALAGEIKKLELTFSWWKKPDWYTELRAISQRSHALSFHTWPKCQRQNITWITHSNT